MRVRSLHSVRRCWSGDKGLVRCCRPKNPSAQQDRRETFMGDFQSWSNRTIGGDTLATGVQSWRRRQKKRARRFRRTSRRFRVENLSAITSLILQALAFHRLRKNHQQRRAVTTSAQPNGAKVAKWRLPPSFGGILQVCANPTGINELLS